MYSTNAVFPTPNVIVTKGEPKTYTFIGGSDKPVSIFFCGECATKLYSRSSAMEQYTSVKERRSMKPGRRCDGKTLPRTRQVGTVRQKGVLARVAWTRDAASQKQYWQPGRRQDVLQSTNDRV
ncbi:hypothetical protein MRB53_039537 [Persea americana]|nr:hypothetical protein MRB53_039537 [Persea americana]